MKDGDLPSLVPQRNPITYAAHRRQTLWQIYFPLGIFILVILVLVVLAVKLDESGKSLWADISIIYLAFFLMLSAIIILTIITTTAYFLHQVLKIIPFKTLQAQAFFFRVERKTRAVANQLAEPFLRLSSLKASAQALINRLR